MGGFLMISYLKQLFDPGTITGSILCGIAATIIISCVTYTYKISKAKKGGINTMSVDKTKNENTEKENDKNITNYGNIKINGNKGGNINFGNGNINITNKK